MSKVKTIIYFYHVPKCAGSYIKDLLVRYSHYFGGHFEDFTDQRGFRRRGGSLEANDKRVINFLQGLEKSEYEYFFIHHHHRFRGMNKLGPIIKDIKEGIVSRGHKFLIFTIIRHPIAFHLSKVNFDAAEGYYSHDTPHPYLLQHLHHNYISKYLLYNLHILWHNKLEQRHLEELPDPEELDMTEENLLQKIQVFDHIFIQEKMDVVLSFLNDFLGLKSFPKGERLNVGSYRFKFSADDKAEIERFSELDYTLYEWVKNDRWKIGAKEE